MSGAPGAVGSGLEDPRRWDTGAQVLQGLNQPQQAGGGGEEKKGQHVVGEGAWVGNGHTWWAQAPPLLCCVVLGESLHLPEPRLQHL